MALHNMISSDYITISLLLANILASCPGVFKDWLNVEPFSYLVLFLQSKKTVIVYPVQIGYSTARWVIVAGELFVFLFHAYFYFLFCIRNHPHDVQIQTWLTSLILESTMKLTSFLDWISMVSQCSVVTCIHVSCIGSVLVINLQNNMQIWSMSKIIL